MYRRLCLSSCIVVFGTAILIGQGSIGGIQPDTWIVLVNADSGLSADVEGAKADPGARVLHYPLHGGKNQQWAFVPDGKSGIRVKNRQSDLYLTLTASGQAIQAALSPDPSQLWDMETLTLDAVAAFRLRCRATGTCLQPPGRNPGVTQLGEGSAGGFDRWLGFKTWQPMDPVATGAFLDTMERLSLPEGKLRQFRLEYLRHLNRWTDILKEAPSGSMPSLEALLYLGNQALADERFADAIGLYTRIKTEGKDQKYGWRVDEYLDLAGKRARQGKVSPVITVKSLAVFISDADIGGTVRHLWPAAIERMRLSLRLERQFLLWTSRGRLDLTFDEVSFDGTMTALQRDRLTPVFATLAANDGDPFGYDRFLKRIEKDYESFFWFWPGKDIILAASGGALSYSLLSDRLKDTPRGFVQISDTSYQGADVLPTLMHEFFHVLETRMALPKSHGYKAENRGVYPEWKGEGEFDYQAWHLGKNTRLYDPAIWADLRAASRISQAFQESELAWFSSYSILDRNRAHVLLESGDALYGSGKIAEAAIAYRQSHELYPAWERAWSRSLDQEPHYIFERDSDSGEMLLTGGMRKSPPLPSIPGSSLSLLIRFVAPSSPVKEELLSFYNDGTSQAADRAFYLDPDGSIRFMVWPGAVFSLKSPVAIIDGQAHVAVGIFDRGRAELWIDGQLAASGTSASPSLYEYRGNWLCRSRKISGITVWNRPLSREEIMRLSE